MKNQESVRGESISLSFPHTKGISNFIKPLSIKNLTNSKIFQKNIPAPDMNLICCNSGTHDTERRLLESEEIEKNNPNEALKKLTKFRVRKRSLEKDLIKTRSWFLASLGSFWTGFSQKIVGFFHSILFGISIFFHDIGTFFTSILLSITKFILLLLTKVPRQLRSFKIIIKT